MSSTMRLTIAVAVIMVEISDDVHMLLPVLVAVMVSKRVADAVTHSIYHTLLEVKCVPFLVHEPVSRFSLELLPVSAVMHTPVTCLELHMKVRASWLAQCSPPRGHVSANRDTVLHASPTGRGPASNPERHQPQRLPSGARQRCRPDMPRVDRKSAPARADAAACGRVQRQWQRRVIARLEVASSSTHRGSP